jgi:hypothetical protein
MTVATGNKSIVRFFHVALLAACASSLMAARSSEWSSSPTPQENSDVLETGKLEGRLKWLGTVIDGNTAEVGKGTARYESYKYERFRFEGCSIGWRETHESSEAEKFVSKQVQEVWIPLARLSQTSARVDKVGSSAYVVSFTSLKLKPIIVARVKSTYKDGSEDESSALATGSGIYFQSPEIARRVAKALVTSIGYCQKKKAS